MIKNSIILFLSLVVLFLSCVNIKLISVIKNKPAETVFHIEGGAEDIVASFLNEQEKISKIDPSNEVMSQKFSLINIEVTDYVPSKNELSCEKDKNGNLVFSLKIDLLNWNRLQSFQQEVLVKDALSSCLNSAEKSNVRVAEII